MLIMLVFTSSLMFAGIGLGVNGLVMFVTPFLTNLWGLVVVTTIGGLMFGYLDAGLIVTMHSKIKIERTESQF